MAQEQEYKSSHVCAPQAPPVRRGRAAARGSQLLLKGLPPGTCPPLLLTQTAGAAEVSPPTAWVSRCEN